jgi:hypothetical protein
VTSTCKNPIDVTVAFSPFDKNHAQNVKPNSSPKEIKAMVRGNARVTLRDKKCPPPAGPTEVCGAAYKYDIYLDRRLDKDPELEVEY